MNGKFLITLMTMLAMFSINSRAVYSMEDISKSDTNFGDELNTKFLEKELSNVPEKEMGQAFELAVDLLKLTNTFENEYDNEDSDSEDSNWIIYVITFINDYYRLLSNSSDESADVFGRMKYLVRGFLPGIMEEQNRSGGLTIEKLFKITDDVAQKYKGFGGNFGQKVSFDEIKDLLIQSTCRLDTELLLAKEVEKLVYDFCQELPNKYVTVFLASPFWETDTNNIFYSDREARVGKYVKTLGKIAIERNFTCINYFFWFIENHPSIDYIG